MKGVLILVLVAISLLLGACATTVSVNVNAIAKSDAASVGKNYVLSSSLRDVDETDLFFQEFSRYFTYVLKKQGYALVQDRKDANLEVRFGFGISDGTTGISTFSVPVYDTIGGETITITENTFDSSGTPTRTTRTIYIPPRYRRVGTEIESRSYTIYNRTVSLEAREISEENTIGTPLWMVMISSVGESDDLRGIMPYMAAAAADYIGNNTGKQQEIELDIADPRVIELRSLAQGQ